MVQCKNIMCTLPRVNQSVATGQYYIVNLQCNSVQSSLVQGLAVHCNDMDCSASVSGGHYYIDIGYASSHLLQYASHGAINNIDMCVL